MNTLEQQTFIDRLNSTEASLMELASYADNLATRLVGYANETQEGTGSDYAPSVGLLPDVGEAASRMSRTIDQIRRNIVRINQALPAEAVSKGMAAAQAAPGQAMKW